MEQRRVGNSGLRVSVLGLGCNNFGGRLDREGSLKVMAAALNAGITFFDTSDGYPKKDPGASETLMGEALKASRQDIVIATKFGLPFGLDDGGYDGSRRHLMLAVEASLRRLRTDWIDLYYYHQLDPGTPMEETLRALEDLITQGKVRYIGCSNMPAWKTVEAHWIARELGSHRFICDQEQYSLIRREGEHDILPALEACGMSLIPYYPLASGLLTGKYRAGEPPPAGTRLARDQRTAGRFLNDRFLAFADRYRAFCEERSIEPAALAIGWLLAQPLVPSVIAGASTPEQIAANAKALEVEVTAEIKAALDALCATLGQPA